MFTEPEPTMLTWPKASCFHLVDLNFLVKSDGAANIILVLHRASLAAFTSLMGQYAFLHT
jgi:hypothetical protein